MLKALGIDVDRLQGQAIEIARTLEGRLSCLEERLAAIQQMLAYEHGMPVREVPPHDPRRLPLVVRLENVVASGRIDLSAGLGKPVTRGHVINLGDTRAEITFIQRGTGGEKTVRYVLLPGTTLDFSWFFDAIEVNDAGEGPVSVQVLAQ